MRIAVVGTGGIGGPYGASLARAGADVTFVARSAHLAAIRENGLRVEGDRGEIHILYELNHVIRLVTMTKPLPSPDELETFPFYSGHSAGHWDGDTLVIETAGFNEKTFLDNSGAPHTDQLRTVERIRKVNGGKELEDVVTIHDPGVFTKDWSARFVYQLRNDVRLQDYVCGEKHRDISSVRGVKGR